MIQDPKCETAKHSDLPKLCTNIHHDHCETCHGCYTCHALALKPLNIQRTFPYGYREEIRVKN